MSSHSFILFAPDAFVVEGPDGAVDGGERFHVRSDWSAAADATRLDVTDGGTGLQFSGDAANDEAGDDPDQTALLHESSEGLRPPFPA